MDLETARRLVGAEGARALAAAECAYAGTVDPLVAAERMRGSGTDPALAAAALTAVRLRRAAARKLDPADAERLLLTDDGLQQATRATVARHRARRLAASLGVDAPALDLCCGVGGDLVELARAGLRVTGVELDPVTAELARHNVAALGLSARAQVRTADAQNVDRGGYAVTVLDPARRTERGRTFDPAAYRPPWSFVLEVLQGAACVKVAPGIGHDLVPPGVEAEWVSDRGEVKEAALWSGRLAVAGVRRRATLLPAGATLTDHDDPGAPTGPAPAWLHEPDGAVVRAGLVTAVAARVDGWLLDERIAYVGAAHRVRTPFARTYEVLDVLPFDVKRLRAYLRRRGSVSSPSRSVVWPSSPRRSAARCGSPGARRPRSS